MPIEITMPKLTDTMTEATLAKWLKKEGDAVKPGDMIAEVETDKAVQELEAFEAGTVAKIVIPEGGKTLVGALIVVLAKAGEDVKQVAANVKGGAAVAPAPRAAAATAPAMQSAPVIQQAAAGGGQSAGNGDNGGMGGGVAVAVQDHDEGTEAATLNTGRIRVSPLARKMAEDKGVELAAIRGTGPDGRIIKRDILEAIAHPVKVQSKPAAAPAAGPRAGEKAAAVSHVPLKLDAKNIPLSNMRQTIAKRLVQSKQTIPHFYVTIDVQMDKLLELRGQFNEMIAPEKISVTDMVARACAIALTRVPMVNASFTETAIVQHGTVDLGVAVALEEGLLVPVIRAAHTKGVRQLSQEIKQLAELARTRKLKAEQMTGSTFTISNLGMFGVKEFNAIINPPESAILAIGGTSWQAVVKEIGGKREVVPAQVMSMTLSADHRVVDGATGAKFLAELKGILEMPLAMLV